MTGIVDGFRKKFSFAIKSGGNLTKEGCKVSLQGVPKNRLILNLDNKNLPFAGHVTRCDFLFVADNVDGSDLLVPIELKKGEFKAEKIVSQLQAGSTFAEEQLSKEDNPRLIAVAVTGPIPKVRRIEFKQKQYFVKFLGKDRRVFRIRCGEPLKKALSGDPD